MSGLAAAAMVGMLVGGAGVQLLGAAPGIRLGRHLAHVSHELRGALTGAELGLAFVERHTGRRGDLDLAVEAARAQLERAALAAEDLDAVWSRPDRRPSKSQAPLADVGALIRRRARSWSQIAPGGCEVRAGCDPRLLVPCASPARLCQALDNLVANALEHGGGVVTVEGSLDRGRAIITVRDDGPGLPAELGGALRRPWRLRRRSRGYGLEIADRAARSCGGRLVVSSGGPPRIELPARPPEPVIEPGERWIGTGGETLTQAAVEARGPA